MRKLKDKHIFVSFEPGTNGYKLGRVLASLPCMHWYSCEENGVNPWNVSNVTKQHFDRITPKIVSEISSKEDFDFHATSIVKLLGMRKSLSAAQNIMSAEIKRMLTSYSYTKSSKV